MVRSTGSSRRWGAQVLASLSLGCSTQPARPPAAAAEDTSDHGVETPETNAHRASFAHLRLEDGRARYASMSQQAAGAVGEAFYTRVWPAWPDPRRCPFPTPTPRACGLLTIKGKGAEAGAPAAAPHDWTMLHGARDGFYARRTEPRHVDWISADGVVSPVIEDLRIARLGALAVVDLATRVLFVGGGPYDALVGELPRGAPRPTTMSTLTEFVFVEAADASHARDIAELHRRPTYGRPVLVALGGESWALACVEVVAPSRGAPLGNDGPAKNGCGRRRPSRSLSDRSIEKRITVARFSGTTLGTDELGAIDASIDLARQELVAHAEGDRVVARLVLRERPVPHIE